MSQPTQANDELYPLLDMHRQHLSYIDAPEVRRLRGLGVLQAYGTKKRTHGYQLTVSASKVAGYDYSERSMVPANYCGSRYVYKEHLSTEHVNSYVFRLKRLHRSESPEASLLRILTPVALESDSYQPLTQCSEEERNTNPVAETRRRNRDIFRLGKIARRAAQVVQELAPKAVPVVAPLKQLALATAA